MARTLVAGIVLQRVRTIAMPGLANGASAFACRVLAKSTPREQTAGSAGRGAHP